VPVKERRALAWVNNALDRVAYPAIDSLTVRATKPVCATGWHSPQLSAPGHTRQRCTRLQADINQSLLVRTVEASLAAGISACRPQGEKGQVIHGSWIASASWVADAIGDLLKHGS
jgi:phosphotransferase system IIB component